ncbi:MAG: Crp/Fnr family transcriptional regulator [Xanthobacteraceae bacterium]
MRKTAIMHLLRNDPEFAQFFRKHLIQRAIQLRADIVDQLLHSTETRLARLLLILANRSAGGRLNWSKISQEMLAEMIGSSRSNVNHLMNKFKKRGLIDYKGPIQVNPSLLDVVLHEKPRIAERRQQPTRTRARP